MRIAAWQATIRPQVRKMRVIHLWGVRRLSSRFLETSKRTRPIWTFSKCFIFKVDGRAYVVDGLCPVVVVGGHLQLSHDVAGLSDLQDLDRCCIGKVNLLEEVHDAHEEEHAAVHLSHDPPVILGREL